MADCIFCNIVKGEIPCYKVYEDRDFIAFLDINPVNPGHVLVVPKKHYELLESLPVELASKIIIVIQKLIISIKKATGAKALNITLNNGKEAGQLIPHVHFHIMPRVPKDGYHLWEGKKLPEEDMQKIATKIKNSL